MLWPLCSLSVEKQWASRLVPAGEHGRLDGCSAGWPACPPLFPHPKVCSLLPYQSTTVQGFQGALPVLQPLLPVLVEGHAIGCYDPLFLVCREVGSSVWLLHLHAEFKLVNVFLKRSLPRLRSCRPVNCMQYRQGWGGGVGVSKGISQLQPGTPRIVLQTTLRAALWPAKVTCGTQLAAWRTFNPA